MRLIATLIADPAVANLTLDAVADASRALAGAGASVGAVDWLSPAVACDISFEGITEAEAGAALHPAMEKRHLDAVVQKPANRRKKLLVTDMESTMIVNEMVDELAAYLGVGAKVAEITRRAMNGEIGFRPALTERVALLGGLEETVMIEARERIVFMPGALTLVATMQAAGAYTALVSGGFQIFTNWVKDRAGFDVSFANELIVRDGIVTGQLAEPIIGKEGKRDAMDRLCAENGWSRDDVIAVGDGANDLLMLEAAGIGVAYHAKPAVAEASRARIDHGDLTALLFIQGYRQSEFITPA